MEVSINRDTPSAGWFMIENLIQSGMMTGCIPILGNLRESL